jgi:hypothetical protein
MTSGLALQRRHTLQPNHAAFTACGKLLNMTAQQIHTSSYPNCKESLKDQTRVMPACDDATAQQGRNISSCAALSTVNWGMMW